MMKQYEVTVRYIAYKKVRVCGKDEDMAYDEAMYIGNITDWNNSDWSDTTIKSIQELTSGE